VRCTASWIFGAWY